MWIHVFLLNSLLILTSLLSIVASYEVSLLDTTVATSSLKGWFVKNYQVGVEHGNISISGWEELSCKYRNKTQRCLQVCPDIKDEEQVKMQSWLRTPLLNIEGIFRLYVKLNFFMRECDDLEDTVCRETFKIFYRLKNVADDVDNDDMHLNETFYTKIDTVAAESRFLPDGDPETKEINEETVSVMITQGDQLLMGNKTGLFLAIVDEGACMSLHSVRVYYKVCPQVVAELARFSKTHTGLLDTSLVEVEGKCVSNAEYFPHSSVTNHQALLYHCTSSGEWQVRKGGCQCMAGYQPDAQYFKCVPCPLRTYKPTVGNNQCSRCRSNSYTEHVGATYCQCKNDEGVSMTSSQPAQDCEICSKLPTPPVNFHYTNNTIPGTLRLKWEIPQELGKCRNISYCVICQACPVEEFQTNSTMTKVESLDSLDEANLHVNLTSSNCKGLDYSPGRCRVNGLLLVVQKLRRYTRYKFTLVAINGVTIHQYPQSISLLEEPDKMILNTSQHQSKYHTTMNTQLQVVLNTSATSIVVVTNDTVPSIVDGIRDIFVNETCVTLQWNPPSDLDGKVLGYEVRWIPTAEESDLSQTPHVSSQLVDNTSILVIGLMSGNIYNFTIRAINTAGRGKFSKAYRIVTSSLNNPDPMTGNRRKPINNSHVYLVAGLVAVMALLALGIILFLVKLREKRRPSQVEGSYPSAAVHTTHTDTSEQRTYVDPYSLGTIIPHLFMCETSPSLITVSDVIGCGEFGEVYRGNLIKKGETPNDDDESIEVAVKQLHAQCEPHEQVDFLREAMALERFKHPNIVKLEAVVTSSRPFMIVIELMSHGCLGTFLRKHMEAHRAFPPLILTKMLQGVARGMAYLAHLSYVHRDLAARNVLINDQFICKVADFGLTRKLEGNEDKTCQTYTTHGGKIAIRWTAPEAVAYRAYSQASDVWSFGIFVWEVATYGEKPYWDLSNKQVLQAINQGFRLPAPEDCPSVLHQLMLECWHLDRQARPTFVQIVTKLDHVIENAEVLNTLVSPASTGADEMFFNESPPHTPPPLPTISNQESHHNYATCHIATDDKGSPDSLLSLSDVDPAPPISTTLSIDKGYVSNMNSHDRLRDIDHMSESTLMLEHTASSSNLHHASSSNAHLLSNGVCVITSDDDDKSRVSSIL